MVVDAHIAMGSVVGSCGGTVEEARGVVAQSKGLGLV